jgi:hypothetical protein
VDEDVFAVVARDEAEALVCIEEFHSALLQRVLVSEMRWIEGFEPLAVTTLGDRPTMRARLAIFGKTHRSRQ